MTKLNVPINQPTEQTNIIIPVPDLDQAFSKNQTVSVTRFYILVNLLLMCDGCLTAKTNQLFI